MVVDLDPVGPDIVAGELILSQPSDDRCDSSKGPGAFPTAPELGNSEVEVSAVEQDDGCRAESERGRAELLVLQPAIRGRANLWNAIAR